MIKGKEKSKVTAEDAIKSLRVIEAIRESSKRPSSISLMSINTSQKRGSILKRLVFTGIREYKFENVVTPKIKHAGDVLIEIKGIGICGTDMHIFSGNRKVKFPMFQGMSVLELSKLAQM